MDKLLALDPGTVSRFSFEGVDTIARVVSIYDPDTVTIVFEWHGKFTKLSVRLVGIDAPEKRSRNPMETAACKAGIKFLEKTMADIVRVRLDKFDKYGRPLAVLYSMDGENINESLVKCGFAKSYTGGTKAKWTNDELEAMLAINASAQH